MSECLDYTLSEVVDRFMMRVGVSKKKYYGRYLTLAQEVWQDVFQNTLWVVKSVWMPTKAGIPFNYIDMPKDCSKLLGVGIEDKCDLIQPLYYNSQLNVVKKPTQKKCVCNCDCGSLCGDVNSSSVSTKLIFTINNVNYYEKTWIKYCANGDIIEWKETPTKKYNSLTGDGGDFNNDYNNDYSIGSAPFSDYTIEYIKTQKKICKLETKECGCPIESEENEKSFYDCCGYYVNYNCCNKRLKCNQFSPDINDNHLGDIKVSECNTKIYYKPSRKWKSVAKKEIPDYLLVSYQTTGQSVGSETLVPKIAAPLMYAELDNGRKEYNMSFSQTEKMAANYKRIDERNKLMGVLNPIDLIFMKNIQDINIIY